MPVDPPVPATLKRGHWRDVWDRPSLDMKVRPDKIEMDVSRSDLLIPTGPSVPKMFALTFVAGVSIMILYVFLPLVILALATSTSIASPWFWGTLALVAVACWLTLFMLAIRESIADRRYADSL
jgi:hypothetical protein